MEYEVSFFDFDYKSLIKNIKKLGGKKIHSMAVYNISFFKLCNKNDFKDGFVRVRDENGTVTLTTKIFESKNTKYPKEYETTVDSKFEDVIKILESAGLENSLKSIKYREKWSFPGAHEIVFDLWPGLPIVLEIDCTSESALKKTCEKLNLDMSKSFTEYKYMYLFGIHKKITEKIPYLNFLNYNKLLKKHVKKNKELFNSLTKDYYNKFIKPSHI